MIYHEKSTGYRDPVIQWNRFPGNLVKDTFRHDNYWFVRGIVRDRQFEKNMANTLDSLSIPELAINETSAADVLNLRYRDRKNFSEIAKEITDTVDEVRDSIILYKKCLRHPKFVSVICGDESFVSNIDARIIQKSMREEISKNQEEYALRYLWSRYTVDKALEKVKPYFFDKAPYTRLVNFLLQEGMIPHKMTIEQLSEVDPSVFMKIKGFGRNSLFRLCQVMHRCGIDWFAKHSFDF